MENEYGKQVATVFVDGKKQGELDNPLKLIRILLEAENKKLAGAQLFEHLLILNSYFGSKYKSVNILISPTFLLNMENGKTCSTNFDFVNEDESKDYKTMMVETKQINLLLENKVFYEHLYLYSIELVGEKHDSLLVRLVETNLNKKKSTTFTISENVMEDFNKISDKLAINKSKFVENSIKAFIEKNK